MRYEAPEDSTGVFETGELELYSTTDLVIELISRFEGAIIIADRNEINTDPDESSFHVYCTPTLTRQYASALIRHGTSTLKETFDAQQD